MKVLKVIVAMTMMTTLLIVGANAGFSDQDKIEYTVDMAATLNIMKGRDDDI